MQRISGAARHQPDDRQVGGVRRCDADPAGLGRQDAKGNGNVWAPEVAARSDGSYILYFTAHSGAQNIQCIGVALANKPQGPYAAPGKDPLICNPQDVDAIDPSAFTDTDGKQYLLYSSGRGHATIWLQQMSVDGITPIGERRALIQADRPEEANIVEAPTLVHHRDQYVLFYSGNSYNSGNYYVNYATSESLASTFVKAPGEMLSKSTLGGKYTNPGGEEFVPGHGHDYLVFHATTQPDPAGHVRARAGLELRREAAPATGRHSQGPEHGGLTAAVRQEGRQSDLAAHEHLDHEPLDHEHLDPTALRALGHSHWDTSAATHRQE